MVQIFNSLTGRKEALEPIEPGVVRMYVCGDTVYDFCHIGHARSKVAFDIVRRYLAYRGYRVVFVRNITDIDDKIIKRAAENAEPVERLTARFIEAMQEDYDRLGILRPDHEPRATHHVQGIIAMTRTLIERDLAYVASNGDVMYSVSKFPGYGRLSGKRLGDLRAGARVDVDEAKRDPLDFVLWKRAKPGEPSWPSPWGEGRPGWHIECSAMSHDILGPRFDIHGGGLDLKFPHHENEIAQSCGAGDEFARLWMHNGFVNVDEEKMSKSLGNFFRIRDVIGEPGATEPQVVRDPEVLRFFLASSHYRGPINYSLDQIEQADAALGRLYTSLREVVPAGGYAPNEATSEATRDFEAAMDDDFNTPEALAALQSLATRLNRAKSAGESTQAGVLAAEMLRLGEVLGILQSPPEAFLRAPKRVVALQDGAAAGGVPDGAAAASAARLTDETIEQLIAQRSAARKSRSFKESDRIRDELAAAGVILEDKPDGTTTWRRS